MSKSFIVSWTYFGKVLILVLGSGIYPFASQKVSDLTFESDVANDNKLGNFLNTVVWGAKQILQWLNEHPNKSLSKYKTISSNRNIKLKKATSFSEGEIEIYVHKHFCFGGGYFKGKFPVPSLEGSLFFFGGGGGGKGRRLLSEFALEATWTSSGV